MIPLFKVFMADDVDKHLSPVLHSGFITQGKQVEKFESQLQEYIGNPYCLTLNAATSGLTLALRLLNLSPDDEVLTCSLTCFASTAAILASRVRIKWVDVDPKTCNMDLEDLRRKITHKTKAILFVHWGGTPIDMDRLRSIKVEHEFLLQRPLPIIEDCAHAFGAEWDREKLGNTGNISVFSFQAIKHLTTSDGGMICLPNEELYNRAKLLRWYGIDRDYRSKGDFRLEHDISEWGYKFHMNDVNATIGLANLPHVIKRDNIKLANYYRKRLSGLRKVQLLEIPEKAKSAYWIYTIKVSNKKSFMDFMTMKGIMVSQVHTRNDKNSCVSEFRTELPQLDELEKQIVSIPIGWWVTDKDAVYITDCIREWSENDFCFRNLLIEDREIYDELICELSGVRSTLSDEKWLERYNRIRDTIYVLEYEGLGVVGTVRLIIDERFIDSVARIEDLVVDERYRGRGYGSDLLEFAKETAKKNGCYKIVLMCNDANQRFYSKNHFQIEGKEMVLRL